MAGGISEPFIRHPIATSLLMVGILFVGIIAYPKLPVAPLPQVDFPTIQVSAQLPGASPDTMASAVAQPLETQFAQISGVSQMTSTSTLGSTAITIQFDLDRNIDGASNDVQAAINAASGQLPKDLPSPPTYRKVNPADSPILLLAATSATPAADRGRRQRRDQARPADQPDPRRRPGDRRRPAEARHPHPARSRQARRQRAFARGCAHAALGHDAWPSPRARSTAGRAPSRFTPTISSSGRRIGTTSSSPTATARRCGCAISARR